MKYVLDSNVAVQWVIPEPLAVAACRLRDEFRAVVHELIAPDCWPTETAHALTKAERQGRLVDAEGLWMDVMSTPPQFCPSLPLMPRALRIARQARIGVYDCLYVALAEREGCELVTADMRLINGLVAKYPFIRDLATL